MSDNISKNKGKSVINEEVGKKAKFIWQLNGEYLKIFLKITMI